MSETCVGGEKLEILIREACREDARELLTFMKTLVAASDGFVPLGVDELDEDVEKKEQELELFAREENSLYLLAFAGVELIGMLDCRGMQRRAFRHVTMLGMGVLKEWRNQGVGHLLLERAIQWATEHPLVRRIELYTYATNKRAIHLYEKFGFEREGVRRGFIAQEGELIDDVVMGLLLNLKVD